MSRRTQSRPEERGRPDGERGQGLLEFALVIAFLLLVLFGIIDFSRLFFGYATMSNGVREGARYAIVHPQDDAGIVAAAEAMMVVIGAPVNVAVTFPDPNDDGMMAKPFYRTGAFLVRNGVIVAPDQVEEETR
jgi:hypothetical protein